MKRVNESYFLSKLNESQDNPTRKFYCELIEQQNNFDSEYTIEKFYCSCKIYYESSKIYPTLEIANTTITIVKYFLNNLNYSPMPKTIFYLNSILLMAFKLLLDSNKISSLIILYSKYLLIINDEKIQETIKTNKSVKFTKNKIINLFKEAKNTFQELLNSKKNLFSDLIIDNEFQEYKKIEISEFFNNLENEIENILDKHKKNEINYDIIDKKEENDIYYVINIDWLHKFLEFKNYFDKINNDIKKYNNFLLTGFDADNVIYNIINNYSTIKDNITSYIGPIINQNNIQCFNIMIDPDNIYNNCVLSKDFIFIKDKLYFMLKDFFDIDFEIKRQKKYLNIIFSEILILNESLKKRDISSLCKEIISLEKKLTYETLKLKIIRCIKYKYNIDFSDNIINIYIYHYHNDSNNKDILYNQNFRILNGYGLNLIDKLYIKCTKLNEDNFDKLIIKQNNYNFFIYFEILDKYINIPFIISINENICSLCNKEIKDNNLIFCDEGDKCINKYCSLECKYNDKKHINFHIELNKFFIQNISIEKLLDKDITFPKESKMGLTGLINSRNNCYINSSLQCLSNCFQFTKYFLSNIYLDDNGDYGKITKDYKKLLKNLWKKNLSKINTDIFRDIYINHNEKRFEGFGQYDASEFLFFFLDKLHKDLNRIDNDEFGYIKLIEKTENESESQASLRWWKNYIRKNDSIIIDLFYGQLRNKIICDECKYNSIIYDPFMILPLNIPCNKFNIEIKYFGLNLEFHIFNINLNEESKIENYKIKIIEKINNYLNEEKRNNKNINKKRKINKKKNKNDNNKIGDKNDIILNELNINNIELILLNKEKKIYKIINKDINILNYINQGYELVAYEKDEIIENIYFYLFNYTNEYFMWVYPYNYENILFEYPLPLSIKPEQNLYLIFQKIYSYLNELTLNEDLNNDINVENEKKLGFIIYINTEKIEKNNISICSKIYNYFNNFNNKFRILEKFEIDSSYSEIKNKLNIYKNKRLILNINLLNEIDKEKLPKIDNYNNKLIFKNKINLYDCLDYFISEEKIEEKIYKCSKCNRNNKFIKKMNIYKEPYYLIIQLNRFKYNPESNNSKLFNSFNYIKNEILIDFPIQNLDLTEYIIGNDNQKIKYNLIGIINHYGNGFYGHYNAMCLNRNNWYCFDDETITEIKKDKIVTDSAYILFYQKI